MKNLFLFSLVIFLFSCQNDTIEKSHDSVRNTEYYQNLSDKGFLNDFLENKIEKVETQIDGLKLSVPARQKSTGGYSFMAIADIQMDNGNSSAMATNVTNMQMLGYNAMNTNRNIFVLGDLTQNGRVDEFRKFNEGRLHNNVVFDHSWVICPGNHDYDQSSLATQWAWSLASTADRDSYNVADHATKSPDIYNWYHSFIKVNNKFPIKGGVINGLIPSTEAFRVYERPECSIVVLGNSPHVDGQAEVSSDGTSGVADNCMDYFNLYLLLRNMNDGTNGWPAKDLPIIVMMHQPFTHTMKVSNMNQGYLALLNAAKNNPIKFILAGHMHYPDYSINLSKYDSSVDCQQIILTTASCNWSTRRPTYYEFTLTDTELLLKSTAMDNGEVIHERSFTY